MESVTALYGGLTTLLFALLSINVSRVRGKHKNLEPGDNSAKEVMVASRAQGNCAEYIGILFVMLFMAELMRGDSTILHILGGAILISRLLHAHGMLMNVIPTRVGGALINYLVLVATPAYVLYLRFTG